MSWQSFRLGDLYLIGSSKRVLKSDWQAEGVPFYRGREITQLSINGYVDNELYITEKHYSDLIRKYGAPNEGDIMITAIGTIGNAYIVRKNDRFYFKDASVLWLKRTSDISSQFVNLWLQSLHFFEQLESGNGATVDTLSIQKLQGVKINVPPIQEQQRIVTILDQAFEGIAKARANAEQNLQNARALFESHLQSVFTEHKNGWVTKTVGELVTDGVLYKPFDGNHGEIHPRKIDFTETGVPFVMASDLVNGLVDTENCNHISKKLADSLRVGFARNDDVLISHKGTIGRSAIVSTSHEYIMLTPQVTAYRIKSKESLLNKFIRYYFMSPIFQSEIITAAQDGSTRAYVGITRQANLKFRYPSLSEQHSIVEILDQLLPETQHLETLYQRKIACLDELKKSLLQQAFTGNL
jgi:type I restriction enzyme, S subunit